MWCDDVIIRPELWFSILLYKWLNKIKILMHLASCKAPRWSQAEEAPAGGHCWGQNRTYSHACKCVAPFENLPCMSTCRWDSNNKTLFWAGPRALIQRKLEMLQLLEYPWSRELHTKCHSSLRNIKHSPHSLNQELLCYAYIVIFFFFFWNLKTKKLGQNKSTRLVSATFQSIHLTKKKKFNLCGKFRLLYALN